MLNKKTSDGNNRFNFIVFGYESEDFLLLGIDGFIQI